MFVRLFVDENLDRMVPISKQPKEKIQAIIDSCTRQFPEFGERARKRIRTYLKSCRRTKRTRDHNGTSWDSVNIFLLLYNLLHIQNTIKKTFSFKKYYENYNKIFKLDVAKIYATILHFTGSSYPCASDVSSGRANFGSSVRK